MGVSRCAHNMFISWNSITRDRVGCKSCYGVGVESSSFNYCTFTFLSYCGLQKFGESISQGVDQALL